MAFFGKGEKKTFEILFTVLKIVYKWLFLKGPWVFAKHSQVTWDFKRLLNTFAHAHDAYIMSLKTSGRGYFLYFHYIFIGSDKQQHAWTQLFFRIYLFQITYYYIYSHGEGNGTPFQYSCLETPMDGGAWKAAVHGVAEGWTWLSNLPFTFHFHALEKEMATHSSVLAWRTPGTGEPGGLPSMGLHRVGHDWSDLAAAAYILTTSNFLLEMHYTIVMWTKKTYFLFWWHNCSKANLIFTSSFIQQPWLIRCEEIFACYTGEGCLLHTSKCSNVSGSECPYLQKELNSKSP